MIATYSYVADVYNKYKHIYEQFSVKMPQLISGNELPSERDDSSIIIKLGKINNGISGQAHCYFNISKATVGGMCIKINNKVDFEEPQLMDTILHEMVHICEYLMCKNGGWPARNYDWHGKTFRMIADAVEKESGFKITETVDTELNYFVKTNIDDYIGIVITEEDKYIFHATKKGYERWRVTNLNRFSLNNQQVLRIIWYKSFKGGLPYGLTCLKVCTPANPHFYKISKDEKKALLQLEEL